MSREIALVGGGHAHVEVIRNFGRHPIEAVRLTVFDPNPRPIYSGMVPGFVAGQYERHELEIDLKALCEQAGARFVESAVAEVGHDSLRLADGTHHPFDVASLDVGSTVVGVDHPGVREFALASRPIATFVTQVDRLLAERRGDEPIQIIGAGAGGVELAFCLEARLRAKPAGKRVSLVTSEARVLDGAPTNVRRRVTDALAKRQIEVHCGARVASLSERAIVLGDGGRIPAAAVVWVTGPAAHPLASETGLPVDRRGFVRIGPTFQVAGRRNLFAVGDCASLPGMRKAGVYAVRAGPILDRNLRAFLADEALKEYVPQGDFLSLLNLGDGSAIGSKWGIAFKGRWVMGLKNRIDRSFMEKYQ